MNQYDPIDLHEQERSKADSEALKRSARELEDLDIKWLMGSKRGRRLMWRLLSQAGVFRSSFNANALLMAFAEGNRNYGNLMLDRITSLCPELFLRMQEERVDDGNGDSGNNHK